MYGITYLNDYEAGRFNDGEGRSSLAHFDLSARVIVARLYYQSPAKVAGGRVGFFVISSFASLRLRNEGRRYRYDGFGDVTVGPVIGWKIGDIHPALAADFVIPVGSYDETRPLNTGANHFGVRPIISISYLPRSGWEMSAKATYTISARNKATDYRSGDLLHVDYSISYPVNRSLRLGVNGYALTQITDDREAGRIVGGNGNRGRAFAFGPALRYGAGKISVDLKLLREFGVRNRAQGASLWVKVAASL